MTALENRDYIEFKLIVKRDNPDLTEDEIQNLYTEQLWIDNENND